MTVWLPLRISTTCDAWLVSLAFEPATKKPQNAPATDGASAPTIVATRTCLLMIGLRYLRRGGGCPGSWSVGTGERTTLPSDILPRGASARPLAAVGPA